MKEITTYQRNISLRLDESCMNVKNRYMVFRENGQL